MPSDTVEVGRRAFEAFAAGQAEAMRDVLHPDITLRVRIGEVYEGREAAVGFFREWLDAWDDWRLDAEQFLDAGDQVVVFFRQSGRGRESGVEIDQRAAVLGRVRDAQIIEWTTYSDRALALKAAGLSG